MDVQHDKEIGPRIAPYVPPLSAHHPSDAWTLMGTRITDPPSEAWEKLENHRNEDIEDDGERYHGRRRMDEHASPPAGSSRFPSWRGLAIVIVFIVAAVVLALMAVRRTGPATAEFVPGTRPVDTVARVDPATGASPPASASVALGQAKPATSQIQTPPPFPAVTIEAESGTLTGSAVVVAYAGASGGAIVDHVGAQTGAEAGALVLSGLEVPVAGSYRVTIYFTHPGRAGNRTALVTVAGAAPVSLNLSGGPTCCSSRSIDVWLEAGSRTINIANPTGEAPAIDRVVVSRPVHDDG